MGIVGSPEIADWKSPAGKASAPNEPNFSRPGRLPEEIVQNKAKLGERGVYRQMVSYGPWLGRRVKRAKRTQFRRVGRGGSPHYSTIPPFQSDGDCAKRTQFRPPPRREIRKTRRPRQKSLDARKTGLPASESRMELRHSDFCRGRQTKPISLRLDGPAAGLPKGG
jgi:hypothetical protein